MKIIKIIFCSAFLVFFSSQSHSEIKIAFIEMDTLYNFRLTEPGENIKILIKQTDKIDKVLVACQVGKKQPMSLKQLIINFFIHPMMTLKIILSVHYEALRLWKKGAIFQKREVKIKNNISLEK